MEANVRGQFVATVVANQPLCREHYRLVLGLEAFPPSEPGQFIQLACRDLDQDYDPRHQIDWKECEPLDVAGRELISPLGMLRRPFSLAGRRDLPGRVELDVIHRVVGVGTEWLSRLKVGQKAHLLGPLGNRFSLPENKGIALLVGGGVGIPPMLYLAEKLTSRQAIAFAGSLTRDLLPLTVTQPIPPDAAEEARPLPIVEEFARHGIPSVISTDDGTLGFRGFVTQALERYLDSLHYENRGKKIAPDPIFDPGNRIAPDPIFGPSGAAASTVIYTCGPEPMMKRVAEIAAERGIACQVAVERAMACGMGTCQSCCIRVRRPTPAQTGRDWVYKLACTDGPVFAGADLLW